MAKYFLFFIALLFFVVRKVTSCSCGCGLSSNPAFDYDYGNLGVKVCDDYAIPPLEIQKPLCPPPPSVCKELGIGPQAPYYPAPPSGCGGSWLPLLPRCLRKRIRYPFCISKANLYNRRPALSKFNSCGSGYLTPSLTPLQTCGCGC
ncbi:uncharacterized protein LOC135134225 [Zophobas morio]|uniref:uncharacterized protein LOC135134225 n=1 Tax=Zophobas morio TaxID=2755281 RepID=UPI003082FA51